MAELTNQHNEIYQRCAWKEQEVTHLKDSLHIKTASQDESSQQLYSEKDGLDEVKNELNMSKKTVSQFKKETNRLSKELEKIKSKRGEADSTIGMF